MNFVSNPEITDYVTDSFTAYVGWKIFKIHGNLRNGLLLAILKQLASVKISPLN